MVGLNLIFLQSTKKNSKITRKLKSIIEDKSSKSFDARRTANISWFRPVEMENFSRAQKFYVKQVDRYLAHRGEERKMKRREPRQNILKKIEKGYEINDTQLRNLKNGETSPLGDYQMYNKYLIKNL